MTKIIFDLDEWIEKNTNLLMGSMMEGMAQGDTPSRTALSTLIEDLKSAPKLPEAQY